MDQEKIREGVKLILEGIGEDTEREGLLETPDRIARMYEEIAGGMYEDAGVHLSKRFHVDNNEMVVEKDITFYSLCEHHMLPFYGKVHVAYVPDGTVVGLSKIARTVEVFAQKTAASGAPDGPDRGCFHGTSGSPGCHGYDRGGASLHDDARHQETGSPDGHCDHPRCL